MSAIKPMHDDDVPLPFVPPHDPRVPDHPELCLSKEAWTQLWNARGRANIRLRKAIRDIRARGDDVDEGQGSKDYAKAAIDSYQPVLSMQVKLFREAGKTRKELWQIMDEEIEALCNSLELRPTEVDFLRQEIRLDIDELPPARQPQRVTPASGPLGHAATFTYKAAANYLGVSERHIRGLVAGGHLDSVGRGQHKRITRESLLKYKPLNSEQNGTKRKSTLLFRSLFRFTIGVCPRGYSIPLRLQSSLAFQFKL